MPSIAQTILDKYNGVVDNVQAAISGVADQGIKALQPKAKTVPRAPLTEEQVRAKDMIRNALHKGVWIVHFNKVDGTPAIMECTLDQSRIPHDPANINPTLPSLKPVQEHLLAVYALDRQGWRSFTVANVTKMEPKL